jgi:hypothetical protein
MNVAMYVRRHFFSSKGKIVFRRELLGYGSKKAIDTVLGRLVDREIIMRLARGVYIYPDPSKPLPSVAQIAEAKIAIFARRVENSVFQEELRKARSRARSHRGTKESEAPSQPTVLVYETDGCPSEFWIHPVQDRPAVHVRLIRRASRKMYFDNTAAGKAIKKLWRLGKSKVTVWSIVEAIEFFTRKEKQQFFSAHHWMPGWLSKLVHMAGPATLNGVVQKESIRNHVYGTFTKLILIPKFNTLVFQL